jgi:acetolactate synthase I/II/III large subunit
MITCGEYLIALLQAYQIDTVFGIPGMHTLPLYRGLAGSKLRTITARHEQGAGLMADGYARATGRPAACLVTSGPGVTNLLTAMGQAYADSVPMVVIASVLPRRYLGRGAGRIHEMRDQRAMAAGVAAFAHTVLEADELPSAVARAFSVLSAGRPRPVYLELPADLLEAPADHLPLQPAALPRRPAPRPEAIAEAAGLLRVAERPLIILGGGAADARRPVAALAEALDAPVATTVNGKGILPPGHPLSLGSTLGFAPVREAVRAADLVLVIGSELGEADRFPDTDDLLLAGKLIRVDLDPLQLAAVYRPDVAILGDAAVAIPALLAALDRAPARTDGTGGRRRTAEIRRAAEALWDDEVHTHRRLLEAVLEVVPDPLIVGDSTQPVYSTNYTYEPPHPRAFWNGSTGFGTLGYALPAAIGAKLARPERPVVAVAGDGGFQFTLPEMATAIEAGTPLIVILWQNRGYGEIRRRMVGAGIQPLGVDLFTPDYLAIAHAYGWHAGRPGSYAQLQALLDEAARQTVPTLIEIEEGAGWLESRR